MTNTGIISELFEIHILFITVVIILKRDNRITEHWPGGASLAANIWALQIH
jgi:hypothetical protein